MTISDVREQVIARVSLAASLVTIVGVVGVLAFAMVFGYWAVFDRAPPFEIKSVNLPIGRAGDPVMVVAQASRNVDRGCSVTYSRFFYDVDGAKHDIPGSQDISMSAAALVDYERRSPGVSRVPFLIPQAAAPGMGELVTPLKYVCNPAHNLWPIQIVLRVPVMVLPLGSEGGLR